MSKKPQHVKQKAEKPSVFKFPSKKKASVSDVGADSASEHVPEAAMAEESQKHEKKKLNIPKRTASKPGSIDNMLIIRLIVACVIFAVSLIVKMPDFARILLLVIASAAAGYDIVLDGLEAISSGNYFATPIVVVFVTLVAFIIGFGAEGAALVILYQIGILLIFYATDKTKKSAEELLRYQDEATIARYRELIKQSNTGHLEIEDTMRYSSGSVLKLAMIFAVIYAIALPLFTSYSYTVSMHRALMIILIATPVSVVAAMPVTGIVGLCYSAQQGVFFKDAASLEKLGFSSAVVIDKSGVLTDEAPKVIEISTNIVDKDTFMNFAAHALYYSEQPVAKAIADINANMDYRLELISDFAEMPGQGVSVKIGGAKVIIASSDYFYSCGINLPVGDSSVGQSFYMTVSDKYIGRIVISNDYSSDAAELVREFSDIGLSRCILLTEDGEGESERFASDLGISEVVANCDIEKKLQFIKELKESKNENVLFVYSKSFDNHSDADSDLRVGMKAKYADAQVRPEYLTNIPFAVQVSRRMKEVAISNAVFAFLVKVVLIFLSIIGYCNIWFAVFIDMAAALATILNAIRVTNESLLASIRYKSGH